MLYAVYTIAKPGSSKVIAELQSAHRAYLEPRMKDVYLGGPLLDDDGETRLGGLLIMEFPDRKEAENFLWNQPYARAGIIEAILLHPFIPLVDRRSILGEHG